MHFLTLLSIFLSALSLTLATLCLTDDCSWDGHDGQYPCHGCLSDHAAAQLVALIEGLFTNIDADVANKFLTPDFQVYSDSTNYVMLNGNYTPGAVTNPSRDQFITSRQEEQGANPAPGFETLAVYHDCNSVTFRWRLLTPAPPTSGIDVLIIKPGTYQIQVDYSEFNNVGLLANFGCIPTGGLCGPTGNGAA